MQRVKTYHSSILDFKPNMKNDLVLIKGVLIHINPDELQSVYKILYETSRKYICIIEYYTHHQKKSCIDGMKKNYSKEILLGKY